ncbi:hypothetical protein B0920_00735 [Massilia sp. KIM]|uniref:hypothetical protein n=1 Tax=Massilia sp. KIM TaxID=1955422 RepID=UPI00098F2669|nr:hypothetical protein [Massilia sp. KIM]OON62054.1 hypothetical protein B0920_00735 [Massilia sp. KIM]
MNTVIMMFACLATLGGLAAWCRAVPTRALGDTPAPARLRTAAPLIGGTIGVQLLACSLAAGMAAAVVTVWCAWLAGGLLFVAVLNGHPAALPWSERIGRAALLVTGLLLARHFSQH